MKAQKTTSKLPSGPDRFVEHGGMIMLAEKVILRAAVAGSESIETAARILGWRVPLVKKLLSEMDIDPEDLRSNYDPDGDQELLVLEEFLNGDFCRRCGCSQNNACVNHESGESCSWVSDRLCSECTD